jgi:hypothetical protein
MVVNDIVRSFYSTREWVANILEITTNETVEYLVFSRIKNQGTKHVDMITGVLQSIYFPSSLTDTIIFVSDQFLIHFF